MTCNNDYAMNHCIHYTMHIEIFVVYYILWCEIDENYSMKLPKKLIYSEKLTSHFHTFQRTLVFHAVANALRKVTPSHQLYTVNHSCIA